jgi:hypothetical protein
LERKLDIAGRGRTRRTYLEVAWFYSYAMVYQTN